MMPEKTWAERWERLSSMGQAELIQRLRQHIDARVDLLRQKSGLGFGVRLQPATVSVQPRFFFSGEDVLRICSLLKERLPQQAEKIVSRAEKICQHRFDLLGYDDLDYGPEIDWHCDRVHHKRAPRKPGYAVRYLDFAEVGDVKVTWELNRHQHLVTLAKAYRLTGEEHFASELFRQWRHWHKENPYPIGVNWASSLEVGMRSLSWMWVRFLLADCGVVPSEFREEWLNALGISGRHIERNLSTYFSPNTHLLGEAVALFCIGVLCPELNSAAPWKQQGWELVLQEARRQVRSDGFHFEQSLHYHVYALDFFMHTAILATANDIPIPPELDRTVESMLSALCTLCRAGAPPQLGDDDGGRVFDPHRNRREHMLDPLATGAVLYGRGDYKLVASELREETLWLLGAAGIAEFDRIPAAAPGRDTRALEASGLYAMSDERQQVIIDAGPQGDRKAGHGHADALSVCWSYNDRPLLIDPGTLEYVGSGGGRQEFRGTAAHNTLVVDGKDQAEPRRPFAWASLPEIKAESWISGEAFDLFVGSHDGYSRLPSPVIHRRWVFLRKSRFWLVRDVASGQGKHQLDLFWHMSPELAPRDGKAGVFPDAVGRRGLRLVEVRANGWSHEVEQGWWSPIYGRKERAPILHFSKLATLPAEFVSLLEPVEDDARSEGVLTRFEQSSQSVSGFRYRTNEEDHCMFFGSTDKEWTLDRWSSDAEFLYWAGDSKGHVLICCNATHLKAAGKQIFRAPKPVPRCEIFITGNEVRVVSSDESASVDRDAARALVTDGVLTSVGQPTGSDRTGA